uniref:Putative chloroplast protein import component Toc86/159 n=1 Tax=Helianthus annuus TaxID=4232 RepID=A0A251THY5_HELAN
MDSKADTSLTGSNSVSSDKTETETAVNDTNGAVNSVKTVDNNDNSIKDSGSSLNVVVDTDDETEGFASGEEEAFETANENLVVGTETLANGEEGEMFLEPSEFVVAKADDDENDKVGFVEKKSEPNSSENEIEVVKGDKVSEKEDDLVDETESEGVTSEVVVANGVKATVEGDSIVDEIKVDAPAPGVAVVTNTEEVDSDEDVLLVGGSDENESKPVVENDVNVTSEGESVVDDAVVSKIDKETPELESVDAKDVKVTPEDDSVVEGIDVDLPIPGVAGVAVVTKVEDETPEVESVDVEDVEDVKVTTEGDSVVEKVDVDLPLPGVAGVAVVTKAEEDGVVAETDESGLSVSSVLEEVVDKEVVGVTDSKFSPLDVEDVEKEVDYVGHENEPVVVKTALNDVENVSVEGDVAQSTEVLTKAIPEDADNGLENGAADKFVLEDSAEKDDADEQGYMDDSHSDEEDTDEVIQMSSQDRSQMDGQIVTDSDEDEDEEDGKELFDSAALKKLEKLQAIRVKFLRLVQRLGLSPDESVAAQVLYRLALIAGRQTGQSFSLDAAKRKAMELEADGDTDLDFSVNILVIGKAGVGKSATINSIFGEEKTPVGAFQTATGSVKEITGVVGGVTVRVFDTPGLRTSVMEQAFNRSVLSSAKKFTKKNPPDIVLYVDRLDAQTRDLNDIPLLKTITSSLGSAIWRNAIVTFTHGASAPPEGSNGTPLSYDMFVTQRSHVVQQAIGQAVGDLRMMSPGLMNPVSLVENHHSCRKNREGQKVLPNGQTWRPQLLMLCYSMKILSEANSLTKPQDPFDSRKLFGFRMRSPPLPYMLSSMLQSRAHPKLATDQGGDAGDSDIDLAELTDSDREDDEDEYDQLPPFKPLKRSQLAKLSNEQKKAYFDEYDYRVKLLQKKQWKEELKRMKELKNKGPDGLTGQNYQEEEGEGDAPAPVAVPLPDMALPPSFDSDNPAYRFRFLEPTSQFMARPVLDTHGWDHDCGYDGVNVEQTLAIANRFPAAITVQVTKDKKDFSVNMDSSISAKHGENMSTMAGFDIQPIGKQLAYIVRGETKFKNLKKNKTAAGASVTFLGENVVTGFKLEDQITLGRQYSIIGSAGTVRFQSDSAYGANIEVQRRELDYPIGQVQSTIGVSIIKWRGDLALGLNSLAQFSAGRNSKVTVRAGINNKMSGQITVKTSSSEYLSLALAAVIPSVISAYKKLRSGDGDKYSPY